MICLCLLTCKCIIAVIMSIIIAVIIVIVTVFDGMCLVLVCPGSTVGGGQGKGWMMAAQSASWWPSWCTALSTLRVVRGILPVHSKCVLCEIQSLQLVFNAWLSAPSGRDCEYHVLLIIIMEISTVFYQSILIIIMEISTVFYPSKYLTAQGVHKAVQNNDNILQCQAENISMNF